MGDPSDRATALGPVISEKQMKSILDYVDIGQKEGASLVTGGERIGKSRLLRQSDGFRQCEARDADFAGGNLRTGRQRHQVQG